MQNLDQDSFRSFAVPRVAVTQQTRIANFLDKQTARIDALIAGKLRLSEALEESWESRLCHDLAVVATFGGGVPDGWQVVPLKRLCSSVQTGRTPTGGRDDCFDEAGTLWATPGDIDSLYVTDTERKVSAVALEDDEVRLYPAGATLLVGIGATVGKVAHASTSTSANQQINVLVPNEERVDALFLTLAVSAARDQVRLAAGSATMPIINQDKTGRLRLAVPRLNEQRELRSRLLRFRESVTSLQRHAGHHLECLREYRSSLISAAVTGQLDLGAYDERKAA